MAAAAQVGTGYAPGQCPHGPVKDKLRSLSSQKVYFLPGERKPALQTNGEYVRVGARVYDGARAPEQKEWSLWGSNPRPIAHRKSQETKL